MNVSMRKFCRAFTVAISMCAALPAIDSTAGLHSWSAAMARSAHIRAEGKAADTSSKSKFSEPGSGTLLAMTRTGNQLGQCPLKHTGVKASVSGYVARVGVKQVFHNPFKEKIEAVYTFPLPENAAVDEMTMKIGSRVIKGNIKKREEAREIYDQARAQGHVASLLDQERPNIFTQSVANIEPGETVEIEIKYVDLLPYESGTYTFAFPTVVGPRFNPGNPIGKSGTGRAQDTDVVHDASRITPPVAPEGERAGHDISIDVNIDAGVPLQNAHSKLHEVQITHSGANKAHISLSDKLHIPNKDFVLSWEVASDKLQSGCLTHNDGKSGFFTVMMLPPKRVTPETAAPKEMVFLIDCSGSQSGAPLQKAKETLSYIVEHMNPNDTFQIIAFNDHLTQFAERAQKANDQMRQRAKTFIDHLQANGGTWMAPAVEKVCALPSEDNRLRIVTFMTDGYVGNDFEILGLIRKFRNKTRWFSFGTGNSVNRFLIDGIAREGGGEADYVLLNSPGNAVGKKFYDRISSPVLTDIKLECHGVEVKEVFPHAVSDVWAEKPLYFKGRYTKPGAGTISLIGNAGGKPYRQDLKVVFPEKQADNEVIKSLWARAKVDRLMSEDWFGAQQGQVNKELKDEIVQTALDFHIMTQYTSFVAVEEKRVTKGGESKLITVPVELPDGVSREMTLGDEESQQVMSTGMPGSGIHKRKSQHSINNSRPIVYPNQNQAYLARGNFAQSNAVMAQHAYGRSAGGGGSAGASASDGLGNITGGFGAPAPLPAAKSISGVSSPTPSIPVAEPQRFAENKEKPRVQTAADARKEALSKKAEDSKADVGKDKLKIEMDAPASKLSPALQNLRDKLAQSKTNTIEGLTIHNGKVLITLSLSDMSDSTLKKLKRIGFDIKSKSNNTVTGNLSIEALNKLAALSEVIKIEPARPH